MRLLICCLLTFCLANPSLADPTTLRYGSLDLGGCYIPTPPFEYKLAKSDSLYDAARDEHQQYLKDMERYINCLERERRAAFFELDESFKLFRQNFGSDAVFKETNE